MDIEIRCTPYSQSALIQLVINGEFDFKQNETAYPKGTYYHWYHDVYVTITENSFVPNTGKQKMFFRSKIKPDGTGTINTTFDFPAYPLHFATQYRIDVRMVLTHTDGTEEEFTAGINFSTQIPITKGVIKDHYDEHLTLKEKQKNAVYLYNKLVKTGRYALEAFCCLLGISEVAGDLNPSSYIIYKGFEGNSAGGNDYLDDTGAYIYFGLYERDYPPLPYAQYFDTFMYIPQNGINSQLVDYRGGFYWTSYPSYVGENYRTLNSSWWYWKTYPYGRYQPEGFYFQPDQKKQVSFGVFPFQKSYAISSILKNDVINNVNNQTWLTVENLPYMYKRIQETPFQNMWATSFPSYLEDYQTYNALLQRYNTFTKFTKCRNPAVKKIATFMCYAFLYSTDLSYQGAFFGTLGIDTLQAWAVENPVLKLYDYNDVPERALYWYKFFKKRKMPLWEYLKYTV